MGGHEEICSGLCRQEVDGCKKHVSKLQERQLPIRFRNVLWCLLWELSSFSIGNVLQGTLSTAFELGLGVDTAAKGT